MSYANATVSPGARIQAAAGVIAIHALLGAGIVFGLAVSGAIEVEDDILTTFNATEEQPEPEPAPPQPVEDSFSPPITAPEPPIRIPMDVPVRVDPVILDQPSEVVLRPLDIPRLPDRVVEPVSTGIDPVAARPRNGPAGWITNDDYPRRAITRELEGSAAYRLVIGSDGRVDDCTITRTSGHQVLDDETCRLIRSRARFDAAKDNRGERVVGTYTGSVTWQIPQ